MENEIKINGIEYKKITSEQIDEYTKSVTEEIYRYYGSGYNVLFGIPENLSGSVKAVIKATIKIMDSDIVEGRL